MSEEGQTPDDAATAAQPAATEVPAEAQEPFDQPEPTRRVHRFRGFDNNIEFGYETLEYGGRNDGLVIVIEPLHEDDGTESYPGGLERRYQSVAMQVSQYYAQTANVETEVLVHMTDAKSGEDVWLRNGGIQIRWAAAEDPRVRAIMQQAQSQGIDPMKAVLEAKRAGTLQSVSATPAYEPVSPDQLREIFSAHEPPAPENSEPFGFNRPGPASDTRRGSLPPVTPPSRLMPGTDIRHGFGFDGGIQ